MRVFKTLLAVVVVLSFALPAGFANAASKEVDDINKTIQKNGGKWFAVDNWLTALPKEERKQYHNMTFVRDPNEQVPVVNYERVKASPIDWRNKNGSNWVTKAKQQGNCGSCWAFAAIGAFESAIHISEGNPVSTNYAYDLSEQYMLSCASHPDNNGCQGSSSDGPMEMLLDYGTISETCFPYTQSVVSCSQKCSSWQSQLRKIEDWESITSNYSVNVNNIKNALQYGPVATGMIVCDDLESYGGGVYTHEWGNCPNDSGHAVLIVGYSDSDGGYFIVKNSWGTWWGENSGFFRIAFSESSHFSYFGMGTRRVIYSGTGACADDQYEENDSLSTPASFKLGAYNSLRLCSNDDDFYSIPLTAQQTLSIQLDFSNQAGNLDLYLLKADGTSLRSSVTTNNGESITNYTPSANGNVVVKVTGRSGASNSYGITLSATCAPACGGKECGDDGCGKECGECGEFESCISNTCVKNCEEACSFRECGLYNGCSCGSCSATEKCVAYLCEKDCDAICKDVDCGFKDGCYCGSCGTGLVCEANQCVTDCGTVCGSRKCGSYNGCDCGTCGDGKVCKSFSCVTDCSPVCGDAKCGEVSGCSCGTCSANQQCVSGQCQADCAKVCAGIACGTVEGCDCGDCGANQVCENRQCISACEATCGLRQCGEYNGCDCGTCSGATPYCVNNACVACRNAQDCSSTEVCSNSVCLPQGCQTICDWRECGEFQGCACGACPQGESCNDGRCETDCAAVCDWRECGEFNSCTCGTCSGDKPYCRESRCESATVDGDDDACNGVCNPSADVSRCLSNPQYLCECSSAGAWQTKDCGIFCEMQGLRASGCTLHPALGRDICVCTKPDINPSTCSGVCADGSEAYCMTDTLSLCECKDSHWTKTDCQAACNDAGKEFLSCTEHPAYGVNMCICGGALDGDVNPDGDTAPDGDEVVLPDGDTQTKPDDGFGISGGGDGCRQTASPAALWLAATLLALGLRRRRRA